MTDYHDNGFSLYLYGGPTSITVGPDSYWVPRMVACLKNMRPDQYQQPISGAIDLGYCLDRLI